MRDVWLGIETSTVSGGVALLRNGMLLTEDSFPVQSVLSEELLPRISKLLEQADSVPEDIAGIAVSAGPGSYTGLRIGIATASGLSAGWGVGAVAVETLRIIAASVASDLPVIPCIRARSDEVFAAVYTDSSFDARVIVPPGVYVASALQDRIAELDEAIVVGSGRNLMSFSGNIRMASPIHDIPDPSLVASLGSLKAASQGFDTHPLPIYLRGFNQKADSSVP